MLNTMTGIDCIAALKALGELNRLRIVRLLLKERLGVNAVSERLMQGLGGEMVFMQQLAHAGKIAQGIFIAGKKQ